jgi:hypothetical protein
MKVFFKCVSSAQFFIALVEKFLYRIVKPFFTSHPTPYSFPWISRCPEKIAGTSPEIGGSF